MISLYPPQSNTILIEILRAHARIYRWYYVYQTLNKKHLLGYCTPLPTPTPVPFHSTPPLDLDNDRVSFFVPGMSNAFVCIRFVVFFCCCLFNRHFSQTKKKIDNTCFYMHI